MTYIPKNRILTNLYTEGSEFVYAKNPSQEYLGYYHKLFNGKTYTGKNQYDSPIQEIIPATPSNVVNSYTDVYVPSINNQVTTIFNSPLPVDTKYSYTDSILEYAKLVDDITQPTLRELPVPLTPFPQQSDYDKGDFIRYFARKNVDSSYLEIDKTTFDNFSSQSIKNYKKSKYAIDVYSVYSIIWKIKGDLEAIYNFNLNTVQELQTSNNIKGLDSYLKYNFLQFYRYTPQNGLFASENELITLTGELYSGYYHVEEIKGPTEGSTPSFGQRKLLYRKYSPQFQQKKTTRNLGIG
jgi:hypothetical protein